MVHRLWTAMDARQLALSQRYFLMAQWVPCAMYYAGLGGDKPAVFPATISFTIRKGWPKWAHHVLWTMGWLKVALLVRKARTDVKLRTLGTYVHGLFAVVIFHLSADERRNKLHGIFAALYMAEHWFLMRLLGHAAWYKQKFTESFALFCVCLASLRKLEARLGVPSEGEKTTAQVRAAKLAELEPLQRAVVNMLGLGVMVFENGMFLAFTLGLSREIAGQ
ncbi:Hypothetical Protein FCC1311_090572 [Hondaea fermentalgiana]|uniref:Uncharacterized protein n=1 Tax=Hondaea fermentalgiana TaxID=2315210 RepID=A0A2R5GPM9_9STRA|nr:Hypothetical Protein FCC1311_090572 [Hondaea fermentalgiana]|eukprot:GBG32832.1 Hypothetical Protein FCC1311_090572 [Hondaea fermentalgiana]